MCALLLSTLTISGHSFARVDVNGNFNVREWNKERNRRDSDISCSVRLNKSLSEKKALITADIQIIATNTQKYSVSEISWSMLDADGNSLLQGSWIGIPQGFLVGPNNIVPIASGDTSRLRPYYSDDWDSFFEIDLTGTRGLDWAVSVIKDEYEVLQEKYRNIECRTIGFKRYEPAN